MKKYPLILKTISINIFGLSILLVANIGKAQNCNFSVALPEDITICEESEINVVADITGNYKDFNWSADTGDNLPYLLDFDIKLNYSASFTLEVIADPVTNLISNGNFSEGNVGFTTQYSHRNDLPFFNQELWNAGTYSIVNNPLNVHSGFYGCSDHTGGGRMMVINGAPALQKVWCQTINVTPQTDYIFQAFAASVHPNSPAILQFSINDTLIGEPLRLPSSTCQWREFYVTWHSNTSTNANICIVNQNTSGSGNDFAIDDIFFGPVCKYRDTFHVTYGGFEVVQTSVPDSISCLTPEVMLVPGVTDTMWDYHFNWTSIDGRMLSPADSTVMIAGKSGAYLVEVENDAGCKEELSFVVRGDTTKPVLLISGRDTIDCLDTSSVLTVVTAQMLSDYVWTMAGDTMAVGTSVEISTPGTYIAEATGANFCKGRDTIQIHYKDVSIDFEISGVNDLGCKNPSAIVTLLPLSRLDSILWNSDNTAYTSLLGDTIIINKPGTYHFVSRAGDNCMRHDSIVIGQTDTTPPSFALSAGDITCLEKEAVIRIDGQPDILYYFDDASVVSPVTVSQPGTYYITGVNGLGCDTTIAITIDKHTDKPQISVDTLKISCKKPNQWLFNHYKDTAVSHMWIVDGDKMAQDSLFAGDSDRIDLVATNQYGCSDSIGVHIFRSFKQPDINITGDTTLSCRDSIVTFIADIGQHVTSTWYFGVIDSSFQRSITTAAEGNYLLVAFDTLNGCTNNRMVAVSRLPVIEEVSYTLQQPACPGEKALLGPLNITGGNPSFEQFINGQKTESGTIELDFGINTISVEDTQGCSYSFSIQIEKPDQIIIEAGRDTIISFGDSLRLEGMANVSDEEIMSVSWTPALSLKCPFCLETLAVPDSTTLFVITLETKDGCISRDSILVTVKQQKGVNAPNIMVTGNGPNGRFTLYPKKSYIKTIKYLRIFDRWGSLVYESLDFPPAQPDLGWDGTSKGKQLQSGVYIWVAEVLYIDGSSTVEKGDITLVK